MCGEFSQCFSCTGFSPAHSLCAFMVYTSQPLGCSARNCLQWALGCLHFSGLSHSGSGSWVLHKGVDSVGPVFCALPGPSSSGDQVHDESSHQFSPVLTQLIPLLMLFSQNNIISEFHTTENINTTFLLLTPSPALPNTTKPIPTPLLPDLFTAPLSVHYA